MPASETRLKAVKCSVVDDVILDHLSAAFEMRSRIIK